jgi:hypothetical protein
VDKNRFVVCSGGSAFENPFVFRDRAGQQCPGCLLLYGVIPAWVAAQAKN